MTTTASAVVREMRVHTMRTDDSRHLKSRSSFRSSPRASGALALFLALAATLATPPAHSTVPVGATPGEFEVTTRGSARYTIPLVVPPGTRGIQPKLSLVYDSQAGNGFVGHGWALSGLSVIHRCGATILLDNFKGGVKYDGNDRFCMDGERLVSVGGTEYRTRHETWQRIFASDTSANPASFTVWGKDGYVLEFGVTEDSRIQAQGSANVRVWALNKMMDRLGNYWTISYQEDNANGDYLPGRIDYTGNAAQGLTPYNSVVFQYESRTDTPPRYEAGSVMKSMQRLSRVLSYTGTTLVRDYRLTYDNSGAVERSRLASVQECGTDGVCLPATQFGWQNGALNYAATPTQFYWSTNKSDSIGFADVDGDGQLDFYGWGSDGNIHIRRWGANGFGSETSFAWSTNKTADGPIGFADINGDGRADFFGWSSNGNVHVRLSNGDGTFGPSTTTYWSTNKTADGPIGFADINGDGRADFYGWSNNGNVYVRLSNGDGTFGANVATNWGTDKTYRVTIWFADVNGDDKADLIGERNGAVAPLTYGGQTLWFVERKTVVRLSNGDGSFGTEFIVQTGACEASVCTANSMTGDINGDGNADISTNGASSGGAISKGDGSFVVANVVGVIIDLNGDGKDDRYGVSWPASPAPPGASCVTVDLSKGDGSWASGFSLPCSFTSPDNNPGFADLNGDGLADLYDWNSDGNIRVFLGNPVMPDLLVSVTNGLGEQKQVTYKPLTDDTIYAPAQGETYPYREIQDATYVVRTAAKSDGLGSMVTTYYAYGGQLMHMTVNERLGFVWIQRAEPDGSWINDYYHQDVNFSGTLSKSETFVPGSVLVKKTVNDWRLGTSTYNRIMTRLFGITEETYELNGSLTTSKTTTTGYDGYGFPLTEAVSYSDGWSITTTNTYGHDEPNWILGLVTQKLVTATAPGQTDKTRTTSYTYVPGTGLMASEILEPGNPDATLPFKVTYGYDVFGNHATATRSKVDGTKARTDVVTFDGNGRFPTQKKNALNHISYFAYDARTGAVTSATDPNGLVTTSSYDGFGRKIGETRPDGTTTIINYAAATAGYSTQTITSGSGEAWAFHDILGRVTRASTQGLGGQLVYKDTLYDSLGRTDKVSMPYLAASESPLYTDTDYDILGRAIKITQPGNRVTTTSYNGFVTTVTNSKLQTTTTTTNSQGQVVRVVDALNNVTTYGHDPFGNLVKVTDARNNVTTMSYDIRGRKTAMSDPDRGAWTYGYNVHGELTRQTDAKGLVTTTAYDALGRMTSRYSPEGGSTWYYDYPWYGGKTVGKLIYANSPGYEEWHAYDELGRERGTSQRIGGLDYGVSRSFDANSRLDVLTYPSGYTLKHVYDPYGHLTEVKDNQNGQAYWKNPSADAHGRITSEQLAGGVMTATHNYDHNTGDPVLSHTMSGGQYIRSSSYTWDAAGMNLSARTYFDGTTNITESFSYDSLNRLTSVTGPASKTLNYDAIGNITYKSDTGWYFYPTNGIRPHAVSQTVKNWSPTAYAYDANGNMTSGNGKSVVYTSFNKPASINATTFGYGAKYQRVSKSANAKTTHYVGKVYEKVIYGSLTTHRHYINAGNNLIAVYSYDVLSGGSPTNVVVKYLHEDPMGSIEAVTDASGNVLERFGYDAWGKRRNPNGTDASGLASQATPKGYTGHEHDDELALINMKAREYDPYIARFLQPDPLGQKGDPHPYAYANNNPFKYTDPTGTSSVDYSWTLSSSPSNSYSLMSNTWAMENAYVSFLQQQYNQQPARSAWADYNSSSSISSSGTGGLSLTNLNTNWNPGGFGGFTNPYSTLGAGNVTGVPLGNIPTQPTQPSSWPTQPSSRRDNVTGSGAVGLGASIQVVYFGGSVSVGRTLDFELNSLCYVSLCGRVGFGLAIGGGAEASAGAGQPLTSGWDSSYGYFYTGGSGLFADYSVNVDAGMDGAEYSTGLFGWGGGGAAGYQACGTRYFECD